MSCSGFHKVLQRSPERLITVIIVFRDNGCKTVHGVVEEFVEKYEHLIVEYHVLPEVML